MISSCLSVWIIDGRIFIAELVRIAVLNFVLLTLPEHSGMLFNCQHKKSH